MDETQKRYEDGESHSDHNSLKPLPREGRIAFARNIGLNALMDMTAKGIYLPPRYVIVLDLDILGWDYHGIVETFGQKKVNWDVVCANGVLAHGIYRDTYAFRMNGVNTNHHRAGADHGLYNITKEEKKVYRRALKVYLTSMACSAS